MNLELKIAAKSLAQEARFIREQEIKLKRGMLLIQNNKERAVDWAIQRLEAEEKRSVSLRKERKVRIEEFLAKQTPEQRDRILKQWAASKRQVHRLHFVRTGEVRKAARTTHLARMFLKGTPYRAVERLSHTKPNWLSIIALVEAYGGPVRSRTGDNIVRKNDLAALLNWGGVV